MGEKKRVPEDGGKIRTNLRKKKKSKGFRALSRKGKSQNRTDRRRKAVSLGRKLKNVGGTLHTKETLGKNNCKVACMKGQEAL